MGLMDSWDDIQYLFYHLRRKGYGDEELRKDLFDYFHGTDFMNDKDIVNLQDDSEEDE